MISVREMHLKNPSEAVSLARAEYASYKAADNQPGDAQPKADRVQLSDGKAGVEALLGKSFARFEVTERVQDEQGSVVFRAYNGPRGFNPASGSMSGFEVSRQGNGSFSGAELKFVPGWDGPGFYSYDNLAASRAEQQFHQCEARFQAEFSHTA